MSIRDLKAQRLFIEAPLAAGARYSCTGEQSNYLRNVLRMEAGDELRVFNGRDGEWRAAIAEAGKRATTLEVRAQTRAQQGGPDIDYLFAPLKRARLDYMVEKATELGVARLRPVLTRHTVAERVNAERMRANAIEAAEQCGILRLPEIVPPVKLEKALSQLEPERALIFCDEGAEVASPLRALAGISPGAPVAVLIGPEGGFAPEEREMLLRRPCVIRLSLGPRVMRADTAAVAALALVDAVAGDWR